MSIAAVLTSWPTPKRRPLLREAIGSVFTQTRPPDDMVVGIDWSGMGEVANMNRLIATTGCEWLAFLHDDDLWLPEHLAVAERYMGDHDVIVSRVTLEGRPAGTMQGQVEDFAALAHTNWFPPSAVVVRAETFGYWAEPVHPPPYDWVDWSNWRRLLRAGARFVHTNEATMVYRFGPWSTGSWVP